MCHKCPMGVSIFNTDSLYSNNWEEIAWASKYSPNSVRQKRAHNLLWLFCNSLVPYCTNKEKSTLPHMKTTEWVDCQRV